MANPIMTAQIVSEAEIDRSPWKIFVLGALLVGASFLTVYAFDGFLAGQDGFFFYTVAGAFIFLVLTILNSVLIKSYSKAVLAGLLAAVLPLILFYREIDPILGFGAFVFFVFVAAAGRRGQAALRNSLQVHFFLTAKAILPRAVTGLLFFLAVIFFGQYFNPATGVFNERLQENFVGQLILASQPAVELFLQDFSPYQTTDETLKLFVEKQITSLAPDYDRYPPDVQVRVFNESFSAFREGIETAVGPFDGNRPLTENLSELLTRYLNDLSAAGKLTVAVGLTVLLFLIVKGVTALFYWLVEFLAFLIFKILLVANFASVGSENRSREFVALT